MKIITVIEYNELKFAYETLKKEFEQYKLESIKWSVEDFTTYEKDGWQISEEQAQNALEDMIHDHDCEYGITWDSVDYFITQFGEATREGEEAWRIALINEQKSNS